MKILLVNDYGMTLGGAERYFFLLAEALLARGHEVRLLSSDHQRLGMQSSCEYQLSQSGNVFNLDAVFNAPAYFGMRKILRDFRPDVIHFHNVFYTLSPSVLWAARGYRSVLTLHDYFAICLGDKSEREGVACGKPLAQCRSCRASCSRPSFERLRRRSAAAGLQQLERLIAPSAFLQAAFKANGFAHTALLPHPLFAVGEVSDLPSTPSNALLFVGRLARQKGLHVALDALFLLKNRLAAQLPKLDVIGEGPERASLEAQAEQLGLADKVTFHGWLEPEKRDAFYRSAILLLQPAVWPEVAGLTVLEAAAFGLPAVVSDIGGLPESLVAGKSGVLVPAADPAALAEAVLALLLKPDHLDRMREEARAFAESRSLAAHLDQLEKLYSA